MKLGRKGIILKIFRKCGCKQLFMTKFCNDNSLFKGDDAHVEFYEKGIDSENKNFQGTEHCEPHTWM